MKGKKKIWSESDIEYLKLHFPLTENKKLALYFNCGWRSIVRKARELNIEKDASFRDKIDFSQFGKGNIPWNKGVKGLPLNEKFVAKQFKKGNVSCMTNPKIAEKMKATRNETIRKEKLRIRYGLEPKTKLKLINIYEK